MTLAYWCVLIAALFIVARSGYVACYLADLAMSRTLVWSAGLGLSIAIFLLGTF